jgi:hypothetical protein
MGKILLYHYRVVEDLLPGDSNRDKRDFKDAKIFEILSKGARLGPSYADVQCLQRLAEDFNVVMEDRTNDNLEGVMQAIISAIDAGRYPEALYKYSVYRYVIYREEGKKAFRERVSEELEMNIAKVLLWDLGNISANQGAFKKGTWIYNILSNDSTRINMAKHMLTELIKDKNVSDKVREESFILLQKYRN